MISIRCGCGTCGGRRKCDRPLLAGIFRFEEGGLVLLFARSAQGVVTLHRTEQPTVTGAEAIQRGTEAARAHFGPDEWGDGQAQTRLAAECSRAAGLRTF